MNKLIQFILLFLFAAMCGAVAFYFLGGARTQVAQENSPTFRSLPKTETEFRNRLAEFRIQRLKLVNAIKGLEREKRETLEHLKSKGVNSSADIDNDDPDVRFALNALKRLVGNIKSREEDVKVYDEAITSVEAQLDELRRKYINDSAMLSEKEYMDLQKHIIDMRERLQGETDIFEEEELRKILDLEMTKGAKKD